MLKRAPSFHGQASAATCDYLAVALDQERCRQRWWRNAPASRMLASSCGAERKASAVDPARSDLDEEQHIQAPQPHRVEGQEVTCERALPLRPARDIGPCPPRRAGNY
jgi:hypothetical protein